MSAPCWRVWADCASGLYQLQLVWLDPNFVTVLFVEQNAAVHTLG